MREYLANIEMLTEKVEAWSELPEDPLVSVWMVTYNHEPFIQHAIESILMQEVAFDYEVVIGEDKSTDRTREIVEEYQRRHPDKIRLRLARSNLHSQGLKPGIGVRAACRGKFVALLEGDDYWTDPQKLQKQVKFLDENPSYSGCFHNVVVDWDDESYLWFVDKPHNMYQHHVPSTGSLGPDDLICGNTTHIASCMYRAAVIRDPPAWLGGVVAGDWALSVIAAKQGRLGYMDAVMARYRANSGGVWSARSGRKRWEATLHQMACHESFLGLEYAPAFEQGRQAVLRQIRQDAIQCAKRLCMEDPKTSFASFREVSREVVPTDKVDLRQAWRRGVEAAFYHVYRGGKGPTARRLFIKWIQAEPKAMLDRHVVTLAGQMMRSL